MRFIDADKLEKIIRKRVYAVEVEDILAEISNAPHINLDDYVPKDFHDKTCEAMAKRHQEEIADMVEVVRCKECKHREKCEQMVVFENGKYITSGYKLDYCSYGEREGE